MATTKVTRNYQVSIPSEIRKRVEVKVGDTLLIEYAEEEDTIKLRLPHRGPRKTRKLGRTLTSEDIETSIQEGMRDCLRS
jgi:AbrB family looped-hinge helix DNA binding protein